MRNVACVQEDRTIEVIAQCVAVHRDKRVIAAVPPYKWC